MEIYQLKTFAAVAVEGNLTRAAERVFTSPPAVSAQLKALEDELGAKTLADLTRLSWVTTPPDCGLRWHLAQLFEAAGADLPGGAMADSEGFVRSMVDSGIGVGLMRRDQAEQAQQQEQGVIWPGWAGKTWLCWISATGALDVPAVAAVREAVLDSWG